METKNKLSKIVEFLDEKKARDIQNVNIEGISILADYFVICSTTSTTHVRSLADNLIEKMKENGVEVNHIEGYETARWILLDYGDIIVHIFHEDERKFYNLERLWSDGIFSYKNNKEVY